MNVPEHLQANVACYNQDARDFVRCRVRALQEDPQVGRRVHIVANLPASAPEFMDAFANIFSKGAWSGGLPTMHLYAFSRSAEGARDEVLARASAALGGTAIERGARRRAAPARMETARVQNLFTMVHRCRCSRALSQCP